MVILKRTHRFQRYIRSVEIIATLYSICIQTFFNIIKLKSPSIILIKFFLSDAILIKTNTYHLTMRILWQTYKIRVMFICDKKYIKIKREVNAKVTSS